MIGSLWRRLRALTCPHDRTFSERRAYDGVPDVLHRVCLRCDVAAPLIARTTAEHAEIKAAGRLLPFRVTRQGQDNVRPMRRVQ